METPIEYFQIFSSLNLYENKENNDLKDFYINRRINNKHNKNSKISKDNNYNLLKDKKIKIQRFKLPPNIKINDKFNKEINIYKNKNKIQLNKKEFLKNDLNNHNSFSEIKKFKTELCHSWELAGTCKYGLNVS